MAAKSLLKLKNYEVHSITTAHQGQHNANIATWVMQTAMQGKYVTVALYNPDYTLSLVTKSGILNINLLATTQTSLIARLGRKTGRTADKLKNVPYAPDSRGCPYLSEAIGYVMAEVESTLISGDHTLVSCRVLKQVMLNPQAEVMTLNYLRAKGLVRG